MTICAQGLSDTQRGRFNDLLENTNFVQRLGPIVQDAIDNSESIDELRAKVLSATEALMNEDQFA